MKDSDIEETVNHEGSISLLLTCDKDVFTDVDFVRQNPMLVIDVDKFEFV